MKKIIVAGPRDFWNYSFIVKAIEDNIKSPDWELVEGEAPGVDTVARNYAEFKGISVHKFPADWDKHGKAAGMIRNREMAEFVGPEGGLLAIWNGTSVGTGGMIKTAKEMGIRTKIIYFK